jgi:hypothetical protein
MTSILCKQCQKEGKPNVECWIKLEQYDAHLESKHEVAIEEKILLTITKTSEQVDYIYSRFPSALNNNGVLIEKVLQYWPCRGARAIYNQETKKVALEADIEDFFYVMKHIETITRIGRAWRSKHELAPSSKQSERQLQEQISRSYWYNDKLASGVHEALV